MSKKHNKKARKNSKAKTREWPELNNEKAKLMQSLENLTNTVRIFEMMVNRSSHKEIEDCSHWLRAEARGVVAITEKILNDVNLIDPLI